MKSKRAKACDISKKVKDTVWQRDNEQCIICHSPNAFPNAHYLRRSHSGRGIEENVVTLCLECHHLFDNGTGEQQLLYKQRIKAYLRQRYAHWNEENLIYKKWSF